MNRTTTVIAAADTPMININAVILANTLKQVVLIINSFSICIKIIKMMRYIRPVEIAIRCITGPVSVAQITGYNLKCHKCFAILTMLMPMDR